MQLVPEGGEVYGCEIGISTVWACKPDLAAAVLWCEAGANPGLTVVANCTAGLETGDTTWGSDPWDPASEVNYNPATGKYEIEQEFVTALYEDGFAPLSLDSARLIYTTNTSYTGYYELDNVASGDLADALGLQDGDILKTVNSYELDTMEHQMDAYQALQTQTNFELKIVRSSNIVTMRYQIVQ